MDGLTLCDWHLIIAAYAYEQGQKPIMSDWTFDRFSRAAEVRGTDIPGFAPCTGYWVNDMDQDLLEQIYQGAMDANGSKYSELQDIHHPALKVALDDSMVQTRCCKEGFNCWR